MSTMDKFGSIKLPNIKLIENIESISLDMPQKLINKVSETPFFPKVLLEDVEQDNELHLSTLLRRKIKGVWYILFYVERASYETFKILSGNKIDFIENTKDQFLNQSYHLLIEDNVEYYLKTSPRRVKRNSQCWFFKDHEQLSEKKRLDNLYVNGFRLKLNAKQYHSKFRALLKSSKESVDVDK